MNDKENKPYPLEVADILKDGMQLYSLNHKLCKVQEKAVFDICNCRSQAMSAHLYQCENCGYSRQSYNSCRNRHCPKCQFVKQEQWVDKLTNTLIPGKYYHVVFTIPKELHSLFYLNQKICYDMLFKSSSLALQKAGANPNFLGADTGGLSVLHTWTQTLCYHPHIHMLVPAGGLSEDGVEWKSVNRNFFLPQKILSRIFRGVLFKHILEALGKGIIKLPDNIPDFNRLIKELYKKDWNVNIEKSFRGVNSVLNYLARYTHRVAIANNRLISFTGEKVSFWYKDNKNKGDRKIMTLATIEFIRRFLQHILPKNFYKIRYHGILAIANSKTKKQQCIALIGMQMYLPVTEGLSTIEVIGIMGQKDPFLCPKCRKGIMKKKERAPE